MADYRTQLPYKRIALVHDWITGVSGAEHVLKALHELFPEAPIFTLFADTEFVRGFLPRARVHTTWLQKPYTLLRSAKLLLPLLPLAVESIDLSDYDLVISSSVAYTKGLILKPETFHINYCHSPTRQLWDWQIEYQREGARTPRWVQAISQHLMRIWDRQASTRVDGFIANSFNTQQRIAKYYRAPSTVIYPPVDVERSGSGGVGGNVLASSVDSTEARPALASVPAKPFFLIVSRLFKHKNIDVSVQAFNKMGWRLVVIGSGPELARLKRLAGPTISILGYQPDNTVDYYYRHCSAFVLPQEEDFGIAAIEAMSFGKPVLALRRGGALEYVREGINGEFFDDPIEEVLAYGLKRISDKLVNYDPETIRQSVAHLSKARFQQAMIDYIQRT